ncbi:MAG TPA: MOSC domain-containing protein [Candidatus Lustribacter sp.]|nr:MOSC domain-containing protein [Candidatus Lustribacter sp.]
MLGTVTHLYRYPVKALRAERLTSADVRADGIAGDRGSALFVTSPGHARSGKTYRGKEQRLLHTVSAVADAADIALGAGIIVEAEDAAPHYFDAEPVSIVFDVWIRDLEALAGRSVDALRFRPNIVADAAADFHWTEQALVGTRLQIGEVALDVVSPITRCVTPSYDVTTAEPEPALQRTIVTQRGNIMGIYCRVAVPGTLVEGAPIYRSA